MLTALALPDVLDPRVLGVLTPDPRWLGGLLSSRGSAQAEPVSVPVGRVGVPPRTGRTSCTGHTPDDTRLGRKSAVMCITVNIL